MGKFKELAIEIDEAKAILKKPFVSDICAEECNCEQALELIDRLKELEEKHIAALTLISLYQKTDKNFFL